VPLFSSLPAPARGLEDDRAAAVYPRIVSWDRGGKTHHSTVVGGGHEKTPEILLKRYTIFTPLLQLLYDFPPRICHTLQRQGGRRMSSQIQDGRYASCFRSVP
jgi:hypothetical protein